MNIDLIGWVGAIFLALCGWPQAYKCYKEGHSRGVSWMFLNMWMTGEILTFIYILMEKPSWPLFVNYASNIGAMLIVYWFKLRPREPWERRTRLRRVK